MPKLSVEHKRLYEAHKDTYLSWLSMHQRCSSVEGNPHYEYYAGRGITVCERWKKFENFLADMGERPPGMTLDRIDGNGNYNPDNCRWATPKEQANNRHNTRHITAFGKTQTLLEWCEEYKTPVNTVAGRLEAGMSPEEALTAPLYENLRSEGMKRVYRNRRSTRWIEAFGRTQAMADWAEEFGIKAEVLRKRIDYQGLTPEEALTMPVPPNKRKPKGS